MSEQRKWGVHDCPNGLYYLADNDGLYIGTGGYILDDDKDGILAVCELLNKKESIIAALKEENEKLDEQDRKIKELEKENDILKQKLKTKYIVNKQYEEKERLKKENEELEKRLSLYDEDNTTTNKRKVIPLGMRHRKR